MLQKKKKYQLDLVQGRERKLNQASQQQPGDFC